MKRLQSRKPKQSEKYKELNLYNLVEAVNSAIEPGEEEVVPLIVNHILATRKARFGNA